MIPSFICYFIYFNRLFHLRPFFLWLFKNLKSKSLFTHATKGFWECDSIKNIFRVTGARCVELRGYLKGLTIRGTCNPSEATTGRHSEETRQNISSFTARVLFNYHKNLLRRMIDQSFTFNARSLKCSWSTSFFQVESVQETIPLIWLKDAQLCNNV